MKQCIACGETKPLLDFHKHPRSKDGRQGACKLCRCLQEKKRRMDPVKAEKNRCASRKWHTRMQATSQDFRLMAAVRQREYLSDPDNRDKRNAWKRAYRRRDDVRTRRQLLRKQNKKNYVSSCFGRAIYRAIGKQKAWRKWQDLVGYSSEELIAHLQRKLQPGMTLENYGEWHIDHIIPVAAFNFTSEQDIDFKKCWALENLQPLWAKENLSKGDRMGKPFQPSLAI